jgi:hypothetical protein
MAGQEPHDGLGQADAAKAAQERLEANTYSLDFSVRESRRYHEKLCAFYGGWRDWEKIVTIVASSSVASSLIFADAKLAAEIVASLVALWATIDYMIAPDKRAEKHCDLRDRFIELAAKIQLMPHTEAAYKELAAARLELERAEPPCKRLVDLQARNEECRSRDFPPEDLVPLSRSQRLFGYFLTFDMQRLENWKAERQREVRAVAESNAA